MLVTAPGSLLRKVQQTLPWHATVCTTLSSKNLTHYSPGLMGDSPPWTPHSIVSGEESSYGTPDQKRGMKADQSTGTSTPNNPTTTTLPTTTPTSAYSSSEADSNFDDQKLEGGSKTGVVDQDLNLSEHKSGAGAISSAKGKECFNRNLVKGIGQNDVLLEDPQKGLLGRFPFELPPELVGTSHIQQQQQPSRSAFSNASYRDPGSQVSSLPRDIESQETRSRPARTAITAALLLRLFFLKPFIILGKTLIKPFYPPSKKKARGFIAITTIAAAPTSVALLRRAGHSVSDMATSVIAIAAVGTVAYNALADSSTPGQGLRPPDEP